MKIVFVGLSNKINKMPFDITTNSGKIVHKIISRLKDDCYLMNLVDYAPLDENLRLRYPTEQEIIDCTQKFKKKIKKINPDLIVSFGNITTNHLKKLNLKIKYRESFRPFAPSVLKEKANEYFELDVESPYMLLVEKVKKERRISFNVDDELYRSGTCNLFRCGMG